MVTVPALPEVDPEEPETFPVTLPTNDPVNVVVVRLLVLGLKVRPVPSEEA